MCEITPVKNRDAANGKRGLESATTCFVLGYLLRQLRLVAVLGIVHAAAPSNACLLLLQMRFQDTVCIA